MLFLTKLVLYRLPEMMECWNYGIVGKMIAKANNKSQLLTRLLFFSAKLPGIYFLMILGMFIDFMIQFPFAVICSLENRFLRRSH
jgi:hypothetical protein